MQAWLLIVITVGAALFGFAIGRCVSKEKEEEAPEQGGYVEVIPREEKESFSAYKPSEDEERKMTGQSFTYFDNDDSSG